MFYRKYRVVGLVNDMKKIVSFQIAFLFITMCLVSGAFAGTPVGGEVFFYNVKDKQFSMVWEVDTPSTCTVEVYTDIGGANQIFPTIVSNTNDSSDAQDRGVMQVDVSDLPTADTTYYIRTVSTGKATGPFTDTSTYYYPDLGSLISIKTEPSIVEAPVHVNGTLYLSFYDPGAGTINPDDISQSQLHDIVVIVDAGGDNPVSSTEGSGWPIESEFYSVNVNLTPTLYLSGSYWNWDKTDHAISIIAFGGQVPDIGKGRRMINTTYPAAFIDDPDNFPLGGCLAGYSVPSPPDACDSGFNVINMYYLVGNQGPKFELNPEYTVNKNATLTIGPVCATDDEGDAIAGFSLIGQPSGMNISRTGDCFTITWTPTVCGTFENIRVTSSDDKGGTYTDAFKVTILNCPPFTPGASIEPQAPVTTDNLTCNAVSNGDPDGDTITFIYEWYAVSSPATTLSTTSTLDSSKTAKDQAYTCKVIAHDKDGNSDPFIADPVTVLNSAPNIPANAIVTPAEPTADEDLTCTVTPATVPDPDAGDTVQYKYQWKCTNCGSTTVAPFGPTTATSYNLDKSKTAKGENWWCEVLAWDGTVDSVNAAQSNTVTIANKPPSDPVGVQITPATGVKTGDELTCSIGEPYPTDPDAGDTVTQVFTWKCTGSACTTPSIVRDPTSGTSDILATGDTAKDQTWSCEVWAQDNFGAKSATVQAASSVTVENSPPVGLTTVNITPDPAYINDNLTCTAGSVTDADGDAISYTYQWTCTDCGDKTVDPRTSSVTSDILLSSNTAQGETWSCEVTAKDTSDAMVGPTSDQVLIANRPPVITTDPAVEPQVWDEGGSYQITINISDPDGNALTLTYDDANSVDLSDPNVSAWLAYDDANYILTANPPAGGSAIDVGFDPGVFKFNFIAEETDGTPTLMTEKLVTATVRVPAEIVDDFEYPSSVPTLADNGWYKLQGTGSMKLEQQIATDPNSNHYLMTSVSGTPSNNSQLNYIIYKTIPANSIFTNVYPVIQFSVNDKNLFYFDAYVAAKNNAGTEDNYFLRYIPQDPNVAGWTTKVSGKYVSKNVGKQSIDPNGIIITEISQNMEEDLYNATGYHYLYLKGIVLRGDINHMDDIKVRAAGPLVPLKEVNNLTALGNENQVTLQWTLPTNQAPNIAGYNIYMNPNSPPAKNETFKIASVTPDKTSYTKTGLVNNVTYCFRVTAVNNLLTPTETVGKTACAMTQVTVPKDPIDLAAASKDNSIELTWKNPPDQDPDLAGYMVYYCSCASGNCSSCYAESVAASKADSTGLFKHYITKDANQGPLQFDTRYYFTVKAMDTAQPANLSAGVSVSTVHRAPVAKVVDNFDLGYEDGQTLMNMGWYRLQGSGTFLRKAGEGENHYIEVKSKSSGSSALDYIIVKWLDDPADFTNPNFKIRIRSQGYFRIDAYVKDKDGNNYFLSYKGDPTAESDSASSIVEDKRWFVYKIGWKNMVSTEWYDFERNLNDDLFNSKGVEFDMLLGVLLRGTLDVDDIALGEGIQDVENLTARAGDTSVLLSWTVADPNRIEETRIFKGTNLETTIVPSSDKNDYQYEVTNLTNGTTYEFTAVQIAEGDESKGVSIQATPMVYKTDFTFDDQAALDEWSLQVTEGVELDVVYDSGVQSNVMYLNPSGAYPDRYYAAKEDIDISDVTGMTCRIKTSTNFVIWLNLEDTLGLPFMLGFVPGGTADTYSRFGNFAYYFLGPGWTDGKWHYFNKNLDNVMNSIFTGIGTDKVKGIYFGGRIYVDDVSIY